MGGAKRNPWNRCLKKNSPAGLSAVALAKEGRWRNPAGCNVNRLFTWIDASNFIALRSASLSHKISIMIITFCSRLKDNEINVYKYKLLPGNTDFEITTAARYGDPPSLFELRLTDLALCLNYASPAEAFRQVKRIIPFSVN